MNDPASPSDDPEITDRTDRNFEPPDDTSKARPVLGAVAVLWFSVFGCGTIYFAVENLYGLGGPMSPSVLIPTGLGLAMFVAAGIAAKTITWRSPAVPEDAPWSLRPAWQSPTLEEDLYFQTVSPWIATVFAVPGVGVGGFLLYFNYWRAEDPSSAKLLFLIFPIAFSVPAAMTLRRVWHRRQYGTSTLTMNTMPGRLGRQLDVSVQTGVDPSTMESDAFRVTLICYNRRKSGSDNTSWRPLWKAKTEVQGQTASSARPGASADGSVEIPVVFDLPADAPPSTPEKKSQRIAWILEVSAETSGIDYQSYFEIPVFEPDGPGEPVSEETTAPAAAESPAQESAAEPDRPADTPVPDEPASPDESAGPEAPTAPDEPAAPREPASPDTSSSQEPEPSMPDPDAFSDDTSTDRYEDDPEDRTTRNQGGDEDTVRCDNCYSAVDASASTCPACGADLDSSSGWFS